MAEEGYLAELIPGEELLHAGSAGVGLLMLAAGVGALATVPLSAALIGRRTIGGPTILAFVACGIPLVIIAGHPPFRHGAVLRG